MTETGPLERDEGETLVVDIEGFEGPLDLLLTLARHQKVDLTRISILALADQYLAFIAEARRGRLEIAADYLVMAAWLAYLKSRLLLPADESDDEPSGEELAADLQLRLRRLEAFRQTGERLFKRDLLWRDVFPRGAPEGIRVVRTAVYQLSLYELLKAYGDQKARTQATPLIVNPPDVFSFEQATQRLRVLLRGVPDWEELESFLPPEWGSGFARRSALASTFVASLELVREGLADIHQPSPFGPIYVRKASAPSP